MDSPIHGVAGRRLCLHGVGAAGSLPYHLGPAALGVLLLSVLLAVYAYGRRKEVVELKILLQGLQEHVGAAPSEEQLDQLNELIARSQRSFKELIDSFEDAACAVSLDGTLRTVNKSVSELVGLPYTAIVGHKFFEFLEEPNREQPGSESQPLSGEAALGRDGSFASQE